ncbi:hypothetical protein DIPPA_21445 [Diplonema papillatum]|nr:hypothetical protein DIPPA_21445 [Diplonema papillatum]
MSGVAKSPRKPKGKTSGNGKAAGSAASAAGRSSAGSPSPAPPPPPPQVIDRPLFFLLPGTRPAPPQRKPRGYRSDEEITRELFERADADFSGDVDEREFHRFVKTALPRYSAATAGEVFARADWDRSGDLDYLEFRRAVQLGWLASLSPAALLESLAAGEVRIAQEGGYDGYLHRHSDVQRDAIDRQPEQAAQAKERARAVVDRNALLGSSEKTPGGVEELLHEAFYLCLSEPVRRHIAYTAPDLAAATLSPEDVDRVARSLPVAPRLEVLKAMVVAEAAEAGRNPAGDLELGRVLESAAAGWANFGRALFLSADLNRDGQVDLEEFKTAVEAGSFGFPLEELLPLLEAAAYGLAPPAFAAGADELLERPKLFLSGCGSVAGAAGEVARLQGLVAGRRQDVRAAVRARLAPALARRLYNFYECHNPDNLRAAKINELVESAVANDVPEREFMQSLYRKYNLDDAGEPLPPDEGPDEADLILDESTGQVLVRRAALRSAAMEEEYWKLKDEEAMHKMVRSEIKKEVDDAHDLAVRVRDAFFEAWDAREKERMTSPEEIRRRDMEQKSRTEREQAELTEARRQNRQRVLAALKEAKDQRGEERLKRNKQKRWCKRVKGELYLQQVRLKEALDELAAERRHQVLLLQKLKLWNLIVGQQKEVADEAYTAGHKEEEKRMTSEIEAAREAIDKAKSRRKELAIDRCGLQKMSAANEQYTKTLQAIAQSLKNEIQTETDKTRAMIDAGKKQVLEKRDHAASVVFDTQKTYDNALREMFETLERSERERLSIGKEKREMESATVAAVAEQVQETERGIERAKQRLLAMYPDLIRDVASTLGKATRATIASPPPVHPPASVSKLAPFRLKSDSPAANGLSSVQTSRPSPDAHVDDAVFAHLSLWAPPGNLVAAGGLEATDYSAVLQSDGDLCFDMSAESPHYAPVHTVARLPAPPFVREAPVLPLPLGTTQVWSVRTERGVTVQIVAECRPPRGGSPEPVRLSDPPPPFAFEETAPSPGAKTLTPPTPPATPTTFASTPGSSRLPPPSLSPVSARAR